MLLTLVGARLYFSDAWIKQQLCESARKELGRDLEVRDLRLSLLSGTLDVEGVRLRNADIAFKEPDTLRVEKLSAKAALWPLLFSRGAKIHGLEVTVEKPEFIVERGGTWPNETSNLDDLIAKLTAGPPGTWPKQTGLAELNGVVAVRNGVVRYRDSDPKYGESRIERFELTARFDGLGQPAEVKGKFALATPREGQLGTAELEARAQVVEADGSIGHPSELKSPLARVVLNDLDAAQVCRHFRVERAVLDGRYQCTLGRSLSGTVRLEGPALKDAQVSGDFQTSSGISLWQDGKLAAGNLPGRGEFAARLSWRDNAFAAALDNVAVTLTSGGAPTKVLDLSVKSGRADGGTYAIHMDADMDQLFASDVGQVLELKDRLGGKVSLRVEIAQKADGHVSAAGELKTADGYVAARDGKKLETKLGMKFDAKGDAEKAEIGFAAEADSFRVESLQPATIMSLNNPAKLAAQARLKLHIGGQEFWKQFGPLLEVMNMREPLKEALDAELVVSGDAGKVQARLDGTLQQQATTPQPLKLTIAAAYDGAALVDAPTQPFAIFSVQAESSDGTVAIKAGGDATRGKTQQTVRLSEFSTTGELTAVKALNDRFAPYLGVLLSKDYAARGRIALSGTSQLVQQLGAKGIVVGENLTLATKMSLTGFNLAGPALVKDGEPLAWNEPRADLELELAYTSTSTASTLALPKVVLKSASGSLDGSLAEADLVRLKTAAAPNATPVKLWLGALPLTKLNAQVPAATVKQLQALGVLPAESLAAGDLALQAQYDPQAHRAVVETFSFQQPAFSVKLLEPLDADTAALAPVAETPGFTFARWAPVLPSFVAEVAAKGETLAEMQKRFGLPEEPGAIELRLRHNAKTRRAAIETFSFDGPDLQVRASAPDADLTALAAMADTKNATVSQWLRSLPSCRLEVAAKPDALQRLQKAGLLEPDAALLGVLTATAAFDGPTQSLKLDDASFSGAAGDFALGGVALDAGRLGGFLDNPKKEGAVLDLLPSFRCDLKVRAPLFASLNARKLLPPEFTLAGALNLKARYDAGADRLAVETLEFARDAKSNAPIVELKASGEVAGVRKALNAPALSAAALLGSFDRGLTVSSLTVGALELNAYLVKKDIAAQFAREALRGVYEATGLIVVQDAQLRPTGRGGEFDLTLRAQTPLRVHAPSAPNAPVSPEIEAEIGGTWSFDAGAPLKVKLDPNGTALQGTLNLDAAGAKYVVDKTYFVYNKPANTPCKLAFDVAMPTQGPLRVARLELAGGPIGVALANLSYDTGAPKPALTCDRIAVTEGGLAGTLTGLVLDQNRDLMRWQFSAENVDVARLRNFLAQLPPTARIAGTLRDIRAAYDGPASVFPKHLTASCAAMNVQLAAAAPSGPVALALEGDLSADLRRAASRNLAVTVESTPAGRAAQRQKIECGLEVLARNAAESLPEALAKPGMPVVVKVGGLRTGGVDVDALTEAMSALAAAFAPAPAAPAGPTDWSTIRQLRVEASASVPVVTAGGIELRNAQAPAVVLDDLTLAVQNASATVFGGQAGVESLKLALPNSQFNIRFKLANIDLAALTGTLAPPTSKDDYRIAGRLTTEAAEINGMGFDAKAMKNWQGTVKAQIAGLVAQQGDGKRAPDPLKIGTGILGGVLGGKMGRGLNVWSSDFGLFLPRMEFEPFTTGVSMEKARVNIVRTALAGKAGTPTEGLEAEFIGGINPLKKEFAPQMTLWLTGLPAKTQRVLRLDQVDPADRQSILGEFDQARFQPVVLTGSLSAAETNKKELLAAFDTLDSRIEKMIRDKQARQQPPAQPPATQPGQPQQPPPAQPPAQPQPKKKKEKLNPFDLLGL